MVQPVNAEDLGRAYYESLVSPNVRGGEYILSGDKPRTMLEMFREIREALGTHTLFPSIPSQLAIFLARAVRMVSLNRFDAIEKVHDMTRIETSRTSGRPGILATNQCRSGTAYDAKWPSIDSSKTDVPNKEPTVMRAQVAGHHQGGTTPPPTEVADAPVLQAQIRGDLLILRTELVTIVRNHEPFHRHGCRGLAQKGRCPAYIGKSPVKNYRLIA